MPSTAKESKRVTMSAVATRSQKRVRDDLVMQGHVMALSFQEPTSHIFRCSPIAREVPKVLN